MTFEQEFLIRLAPIYLACRFRLNGGTLVGRWPPSDMAFDYLGAVDYSAEMRLLCAEVLRDQSERTGR